MDSNAVAESADEDALLNAVMDRIIPADRHPGATGFAAHRYVGPLLRGDAAADREPIRAGLSAVDAEARRRFGRSFTALPADGQDAVLHGAAGDAWFQALVILTSEGVYADPGNGGNTNAASWTMVGYEHRLPDGPSGPPKQPPPPFRAPVGGNEDYDAVVVGTGAGGGVAACILAEAGKRVLLLERGNALDYRSNGHRDHVRNAWLARYGTNAGPAVRGNPRVFVAPDGSERTVAPNEPEYHNLAAGVGSGTAIYGGQAWRFHPEDFRMASRYGVPDGSSLTDWPFDYDALAPWYERAEWELGVAGDAAGNRNQGKRGRGYPMPPLPRYGAAEVLAEGAAKLGIATFSPPLLMNSVPYGGRGACIECGSCVGFPCPTDGKTGTQNTVIPRAIATGRCDLATGAAVERVDTDRAGKVTGVRYVRPDGQRTTIRAGAVVLACGAIETARLMLLSAAPAHPDGLGNARGLVGRNLQGHVYPAHFALFDRDVHVSRGPGVTIATTDWNHGNEGIIGGAMLADDFVLPPVMFWHRAFPPGVPRWGQAAKDFMRDHYRQVLQLKGPVHEIPNLESRVTLARDVTDRNGLRVARLSGTIHPETLKTAHFIHGKGRAWLEAAGARKIWGPTPRLVLSAHSHQAGTCRMGTDPANSVTDPYGRVWGHDNLFISDSSLHPTNGGYNPVLTIFALAFRNAEHTARSL